MTDIEYQIPCIPPRRARVQETARWMLRLVLAVSLFLIVQAGLS